MTNAGGLPTYLTNKAKAMAAHAASFVSGDAVRETIAAECSASDLSGVRRLQIGGLAIVSDSGPGFGGAGLGPSSPELLLGVLSSCLTHTYLIGAALQGVPLERVHVRFEAENNDAAFLGLTTSDPTYPFNIRATVRVESSAAPEALAALHAYAATSCPMTRLVREPQTITITVES